MTRFYIDLAIVGWAFTATVVVVAVVRALRRGRRRGFEVRVREDDR